MKNKFNNLTSKEWLPFQKSFYKYVSNQEVYKENILFFTKYEGSDTPKPNVYLKIDNETFNKLGSDPDLGQRNIFNSKNIQDAQRIDFILMDVVPEIMQLKNKSDFNQFMMNLFKELDEIIPKLLDRKFLCILCKNVFKNNSFAPIAWHIGKILQSYLTLKDEKIGINISQDRIKMTSKLYKSFQTESDTIYNLYFRKDEHSQFNHLKTVLRDYSWKQNHVKSFNEPFPAWNIVKPPPRDANEILHPAKYPEVLIEKFINYFTVENENIFDPMSCTGSTQVAALKNSRNAYGTELSDFFGRIAMQRCEKQVGQTDLFFEKNSKYNIKVMDARKIKKSDFPIIDYIITSPPYWDMLNMKGAENQAKRNNLGLKLNYSNSEQDLGNISDYDDFLNDLIEIYFKLNDLLKPGGYFTIIVKNIKKKGMNYPFAWDLAFRMAKHFNICSESFWCQDDLSIAPYGYGNTWVSNTFHHYCLNFQKPIS